MTMGGVLGMCTTYSMGLSGGKVRLLYYSMWTGGGGGEGQEHSARGAEGIGRDLWGLKKGGTARPHSGMGGKEPVLGGSRILTRFSDQPS